jgi:pimeloyl-ACP methyl ester carboxylesterase
VRLNFKSLGNSGNPVIILHGVFGSLDNWYSVGKKLSENFRVFLLDARNHGNSPHSSIFDYKFMAGDVIEFIQKHELTGCHLIGHSMGGKTAMNLACDSPELVDKLCVVDISPKHYMPHHQKVFEAFHSVQLNKITSRKDAEESLSATISDPGIRLFLLKNLARSEQGFTWKINLNVIEENIDEIGKGLDREKTFEGPTLFLKGDKSDYISDDDFYLMKSHFPEFKLITIPQAGHWVHAEQPDKLIEHVVEFLL